MPSNVKLTTAEFRAWRVNKAQWVSPEGYVLRAVTPEEERALFPAIERAKLVGRTQSYELTVVYKHEDEATGRVAETKQPMAATVRITLTGRERHNYVVDVFVNGCRYIKGREIIQKRMLATHGECNLYGPNGKRLCVVRNPAMKRPTYSESQRAAPRPENCHCRGWKDKGDPGRHHAACNWNEKAPPDERALPFEPVVEATPLVDSPEPIESLAFDPQSVRTAPAPVDRSRLPPPPAPPVPGMLRSRVVSGAVQRQPSIVEVPVYAGVPQALPPEQPVVRSTTPPITPVLAVHGPNDCPEDCRGVKNPAKAWRWPGGRRPERNQHHPLCPYDGGYRKKTRNDQVWMLYDLERQAEVREATLDEVTQSEVELGRSGTRSITVAGKIFAVVQSAAEKQPEASPPPKPPPQNHAEKRAAALEASRLPGVPTRGTGLSSDETSLVARLEARIAELEGRTLGQAQVGGESVVRLPPARAVGQPADHLRNDLGLVGNQQVTDDIPTGPVTLDEPEAFVDPLAPASAPRRPVDYHPGAMRPKGFVPPALPGAGAVAAPSDDVLAAPEDEAPESAEDDAQEDAEVARILAEASALEAQASEAAPAV